MIYQFPRISRGVSLAALAAFAMSFSAGCDSERTGESVSTVGHGPFEVFHEEEGRLLARNTLSVSSRIGGQIVYVVKDLSHVEKGEILVELDKTDIETRLRRERDELAGQITSLEEAELNLEIVTAQLEIDLERRKAAVELAASELEEIRAGTKPEDIAMQEKSLQAAKSVLVYAEGKVEEFAALAERGFATEAEVDRFQYELELARSRYEKAALNLANLKAYPSEHELTLAELALAEARNELAIARSDQRSRIAQLGQSVSWSRSGVERLADRIKRREWDLENCTIRAPRSGLALLTERHDDGTKVSAGMRTWPGYSLVEFPDMSSFKVTTQVPESIVRHFSIGDEVEVRIDRIPDVVFRGEVGWIDAWARDRNQVLAEADQRREGLSGVRVFSADVNVVDCDERMRLGSRAVVVFRSVIEDAIYVDRRAVERRGGRAYVRVVEKAGEVRLAPVVLGESNKDYFVVVEGVRPGTRVSFVVSGE